MTNVGNYNFKRKIRSILLSLKKLKILLYSLFLTLNSLLRYESYQQLKLKS
jgi:hypothetical protein